ncbi:phage holin family protein [Candidatus Woesebacteria bacterium]|nr:phage holin family protein [Candidatus Woesebacteria bacterium]
MKFVIHTLVQGIAIFLTAYILPGVFLENYWAALLVAIVLGIVNATIKPLLFLLTLPITLVTLGLFTFILNAIIILLVDALIPGFAVGGFLNALLFSLLLSLIGGILHRFTSKA